MSEKSALGTVTWPGGSPVATLWSDRTWTVPGEPGTEDTLELIYSDAYRGPQDGAFGPGALSSLAKGVGGTFDYPDRPGHDFSSADTVRTLEPAKKDSSGRINFDATATRTFIKGLARHLADKFGITYKDKPDA